MESQLSYLLAAQASDSFAGLIPLILAPVIVLIILLIGCVVLYMSLRYARQSREMLHHERLKSTEAGLPWQDEGAETVDKRFMHNAFWISFWMIVIGCASPFTVVASAMDKSPFKEPSVAAMAWICAASASVGTAICATILMLKSRSRVETSKFSKNK